MKRLLAIVLTLVIVLSFAACSKSTNNTQTPTDATTGVVTAPENAVIRLSTTTSVNDSGLLPYLLPVFEAKTGYKVEVSSAGTGAALQAAKDGNADLVLVHAKASEEEFIEGGYGLERISFMYNYFVIVGPASDPAGIKDSASAADAFAKIAETQSTFISRGDESGTHKAELKIWGENAPDAETQSWYVSAGQGMGACLTMAKEQGAYCLTDKATFLAMQDKGDLEIVLAEGDDMKNTYSLIECNPETLTDLNTEGSKAFIEWMTSDEASALIAEYGVTEYGQALFYLLNK